MGLKIICAVLVAFGLALDIGAAPSPATIKSTAAPTLLEIDNDTFIGVNRILMFVTNHGSFGRDLEGIFGYDYGTWYPFLGDTAAISANIGGVADLSPQYSAGLWLGGYVGSDLRVTVAEYSDEYVPGPMVGGEPIEDNPAFRVYKLYADSLEDNPNEDYLDWPDQLGAPVDGLGNPAMLGHQMLWSQFNDADPEAHIYQAGGTLPLGIEVRHTTYAFESEGPMGDLVFIKYKLYNLGENEISDMYITLWMDPDVGSATDDMVGCDTNLQMFYAYNADNDDAQYGNYPPAAGYAVLKGPIIPSENDTAYFDGTWMLEYRNMELSAVGSYIGGTDPNSALESYNLMRGLQMDGSPLANGTAFAYPGDPVTSTGDIDLWPTDKRIMGSFGPMNFNPGDSQFVLLAFGCAQAADRLSSITLLKSYREAIDSYVSELEDAATFGVRDHETFIDANRILMFVTNYGLFGRDIASIFGYMAGTWFPYPGDTSYISQNIDDAASHSPLFAAGLWLGGIDSVTGDIRVAIGEFSSEYVPGPMYLNTYAPTDPSFQTYKLYYDSLAHNPNSDYLNWPFALGAPMDEFGEPEIRGNQTLWSVFNDANPAAHTNDAGQTAPLGIEVQQTTWAWANLEGEDSSLYIRYKLYNKGENIIKNMYIGHWSDPDIGFASDDLVGCDTLNDIWYCYNADDADDAYGSSPPVLGFRVLAGPVIPSPGSTANFDDQALVDFKNLGVSAFTRVLKGPVFDYEQAYGYLQGLSQGNIPYVYNSDTLTYMHSGDPVTGTGDLDMDPSDRYMLAASGPFDFRPGDSQFVLIRMALARGADNLEAIDEVRALLNSDFDPYSDTVVPAPPSLPTSYAVSQNYPNPFNPKTTINYSLVHTARVTIDIYNILGQKVRRLVDAVRPAGEYYVEWDGTNSSGQVVGTGLYFYRFKAGDLEETKKMVLLK